MDTAIIVATISAVTTIIVALIVNGLRRDVAVTHKLARRIDNAVNNVPPGTPPLVQRVGMLEVDFSNHRKWTEKSLKLIAAEVGATLPKPEEPQ